MKIYFHSRFPLSLSSFLSLSHHHVMYCAWLCIEREELLFLLLREQNIFLRVCVCMYRDCTYMRRFTISTGSAAAVLFFFSLSLSLDDDDDDGTEKRGKYRNYESMNFSPLAKMKIKKTFMLIFPFVVQSKLPWACLREETRNIRWRLHVCLPLTICCVLEFPFDVSM
jgi:hypothetical protein